MQERLFKTKKDGSRYFSKQTLNSALYGSGPGIIEEKTIFSKIVTDFYCFYGLFFAQEVFDRKFTNFINDETERLSLFKLCIKMKFELLNFLPSSCSTKISSGV